jgi:5-methylthioadenosine/S-adenosylhomocysteine deaminase
MFEGMKVSALLQKISCGNAAVLSSRDVLEMATIRGAGALGLEKQVGTLEVGKRADIVLVDLKAELDLTARSLRQSCLFGSRVRC